VTDSGGVQKEAYFLKKPCITVYESSEWVETVEDGWNFIASPTNRTEIIEAVSHFQPTSKQKHHFGDGKASEKIAKIINEFEKSGR